MVNLFLQQFPFSFGDLRKISNSSYIYPYDVLRYDIKYCTSCMRLICWKNSFLLHILNILTIFAKYCIKKKIWYGPWNNYYKKIIDQWDGFNGPAPSLIRLCSFGSPKKYNKIVRQKSELEKILFFFVVFQLKKFAVTDRNATFIFLVLFLWNEKVIWCQQMSESTS